MSKRKKLLISCAACGAAIAALVLLSPREPTYKGRVLSFWMLRYDDAQNSHHQRSDALMVEFECTEAVREIGAAAVPYLLDWMRFEESASTRWWRGLVKNIASAVHISHSGSSAEQRLSWLSVWAFQVLGTKAESAVPELTNLIYRPTADPTGDLAAEALVRLGDVGEPSLAAALSSTNIDAKRRAAEAAVDANPKSTRLGPLLEEAVDDKDFMCAVNATRALVRLNIDSSRAVVLLTNRLGDETQMQAALNNLRQLGSRAHSALPAVSNLLSHTNRFIRREATNTIKAIVGSDRRNQ